MFQKIVKVSLCALVFLMPLFWLPWSVEAFDFNKGYLLFFLVSVGLLAWLGQMIFKEKRLRVRYTPLDLFVLGFLVIVVLASVLAVDRGSSVFGFYGRFWPSLLGVLSLGGFYFLLINNVQISGGQTSAKNRELSTGSGGLTSAGLLKAFFMSSFLVVVVAYFSLFGLWGKINQVLGGRLPGIMALRTFSPVGGTLEGLAMFLAPLVVLLVVLLALRPNREISGGQTSVKNRELSTGSKGPTSTSTDAKKTNKKGSQAWPKYLLLLASLGLLVLIDFTAAWIVVGVALLVFLAFSFWKRLFKENVNRLSLAIFLLLIALLFVFANPIRNLLPSDSALSTLPAEVMLSQKASWGLAWQGLKDRPVLGTGPSNFSYVFSKHKTEGFLASPFWQLRFDRAGSAITEFIATCGILGALAWLAMVIMFCLISYFFIASFKVKGVAAVLTGAGGGADAGAGAGAGAAGGAGQKKPSSSPSALPFLITFVALLIVQLVYYQSAPLSFFFWLVLGLGVASWRKAPRQKQFSFRDFPELGLVFSIIFWVALITACFLYFNLAKYYLADIYYRNYLINPAQNLAQLEKAVRLVPSRTTYHVVLGRAYLQQFQEEVSKETPDTQVISAAVALAVRESKTAVSLSPNWVVAQEMAGVVYRNIRGAAQGAQEWAVKSFERALELEPKNPVILTELGKLALFSQELEKARELFEKAVAMRPDYIDAQLQLAFLEDQEGKVEEARGRLESLVRLSPFSVEAHFQLGRLYYNQKEYDKAVEQFESAIALFPNHSNSLYSLGLVYEQKGQTTRALEMFIKVLQLNPGNEDVENKIAELKREVKGEVKGEEKGEKPPEEE